MAEVLSVDLNGYDTVNSKWFGLVICTDVGRLLIDLPAGTQVQVQGHVSDLVGAMPPNSGVALLGKKNTQLIRAWIAAVLGAGDAWPPDVPPL